MVTGSRYVSNSPSIVGDCIVLSRLLSCFECLAIKFLHLSPAALFTLKANSSAQQSASASAWFPSSEEYGIVNEMEHVEAQKGCYSSTEGLLYLLTVLIKTCGCPPDLGSQWRPRPGCTPYIEYVVDFVLPRAMGSKKGEKALYFASSADKYRLISRALEVIEAAVIRYYVPTTEMNLVYSADSHTSTAKKVTLSSQVAAVSYESAMKKASENGFFF